MLNEGGSEQEGEALGMQPERERERETVVISQFSLLPVQTQEDDEGGGGGNKSFHILLCLRNQLLHTKEKGRENEGKICP